VAWNTHKWYLNDLAGKGIPVIPTRWVGPGDGWKLPAGGEYVLKPATGGGGNGAGRYQLDRARDQELATAHIRRLHKLGGMVMLQPYLSGVDCCGETNLVYLDGEYSHAIHRPAVLAGPDTGVAPSYAAPTANPRPPTVAEHELAERVLAALPMRREDLLFARVDVVPGPDGGPVVIEVDVTGPSLFLRTADGAAARLAAAVADRVTATKTRGDAGAP
jgi:glutathione synthase/RimK-type ligase-like ATP-grasp enzyme